MVSHGSSLTVVCFTHWEEELAFCMAGISHWQEPNSSLESKRFGCAGVLRSRFSFGPIVCSSSTASPGGDGEDTCPTLICGSNSGQLTTPSASQSCSTKSGEVTPLRQRLRQDSFHHWKRTVIKLQTNWPRGELCGTPFPWNMLLQLATPTVG